MHLLSFLCKLSFVESVAVFVMLLSRKTLSLVDLEVLVRSQSCVVVQSGVKN